jgi:dipeptidyl aminopeptidase/acylaminoacyl peptidase
MLAACGGSPGRIANPRRGVSSFVKERQLILAETASGLTRIALDGSAKDRVASGRYHHLSSTADGRTLAIGDSATNIFVVVPEDSSPRRISQLDGRAGAAALSPDGKRLAVSRHADFTLPQSQWKTTEDDAIYLVDTQTMTLDVIPATRDESITGIRWSADGSALILSMMSFGTVRLDLATRARTDVDRDVEVAAMGAGTRCSNGDMIELAGHRGDDGIDVLTSKGTTRVVKIVGRKRGFHDYQATIGDAVFSASCRYIVFEMNNAVYVADRTSGNVGHLIDGSFVKMLVTP